VTRRPDNPDTQPLMLPCEVGDLFRVDPKTVTRWANSGRIPAEAVLFTPGGARRFIRAIVVALYEQTQGGTG
jgi:predicted site-specific integrase-resolvase